MKLPTQLCQPCGPLWASITKPQTAGKYALDAKSRKYPQSRVVSCRQRRKISVVIQSITKLEYCRCFSLAGVFAQLCQHVSHTERVPVLNRAMTNRPFRLRVGKWLTAVTNWSWCWYFAPSRVIDKGEQTGSFCGSNNNTWASHSFGR